MPKQGMKDNKALQSAELILSGENPHSEKLNARYMLNLLDSVSHTSKIAYKICSAAESNFQGDMREDGINFPGQKEESKTYYHTNKKTARPPVSKEDWDALKNYFSKLCNDLPEGKPQPVFENLMRLADYLDLKETEKQTLELIYAIESDIQMSEFLSSFLDGDKGRASAAVACMLGEPQKAKEVHKALDENGPLMSYGLLASPYDEFGHEIDKFCVLTGIDDCLRESLMKADMSEDEIVSTIVGDSMTAELDIDDFSYKGEELEFLKEFISNAVEQKQKGVNILLYGPPGSGKTALASSLANDLGLKMYAAGENPQDADNSSYAAQPPTSSSKRLASLLQMQAMLKDSKKTVLLFDEIEDLLLKGTDSSKKADTESKIQINRLLENNDVVTIWTGNDPEKFHEAVRQRFTMSLHMGYPPVKIRQKIWERQLGMQNVKLKPEETRELARKYQAPPRMIAKAARAAAITGKGLETIERSLESDARISFGSINAIMDERAVSSKFNLELTNGGEGMKEKVASLIERGKNHKPFSVLVEGQPGTGVGSVLRYMGENMVMNVAEVSMNALVVPTPFSTPAQNIQMAFETAANEGQFLVVHDIGALAPDPANSNAAQWNNGLVEVFNKCAASHRLPFAVTNNNTAKLPEVFTHRFSHQLKLEPLTEAQSRKAFSVYFDKELSADQKLPEKLLVSDFANTARLVGNMDETEQSTDKLRSLLEKQKELRSSSDAPGMGFGANIR